MTNIFDQRFDEHGSHLH